MSTVPGVAAGRPKPLGRSRPRPDTPTAFVFGGVGRAMTVLLTGYEPFGEYDVNPTEAIAGRLDGRTIAGEAVVGAVLPVEFSATYAAFVDHMERVDPGAVLSLGLAGGRNAISVERVGINVNDTESTPDNAGETPHDEPIRPDGPPAYFATIPVVGIVESLIEAGIPARVSNTAGTHLCNNILYGARRYVEENGLDVPSGFVHVPLSSEQAAERAADTAPHAEAVEPSLPLDLQVEAIERAIEATVEANRAAPPSGD